MVRDRYKSLMVERHLVVCLGLLRVAASLTPAIPVDDPACEVAFTDNGRRLGQTLSNNLR